MTKKNLVNFKNNQVDFSLFWEHGVYDIPTKPLGNLLYIIWVQSANQIINKKKKICYG